MTNKNRSTPQRFEDLSTEQKLTVLAACALMLLVFYLLIEAPLKRIFGQEPKPEIELPSQTNQGLISDRQFMIPSGAIDWGITIPDEKGRHHYVCQVSSGEWFICYPYVEEPEKTEETE